MKKKKTVVTTTIPTYVVPESSFTIEDDPNKQPQFNCSFGHMDGHTYWEKELKRWVHFCATCAST